MAGGKILLRIDDLDTDRVRPEYVDDIFRTLEDLGIDWDEGPQGPDDLAAVWSQHHRLGSYHDAIAELRASGHLFACDCSRAQVRSKSETMDYTGTCSGRGLPLDTVETALRMNYGTSDIPYVVIRQKNLLPSYMISSIVDDVLFGVTHIVRGADLAPSSNTQISIAQRLPSLSTFCGVDIHHHPLILGAKGEKLSKTQGSQKGPLPDLRLRVEEYVNGLA